MGEIAFNPDIGGHLLMPMFSVPLSKVKVLLVSGEWPFSRLTTAFTVSEADLRGCFVSISNRLLCSTKELKATRLFLDTRLSPSQ